MKADKKTHEASLGSDIDEATVKTNEWRRHRNCITSTSKSVPANPLNVFLQFLHFLASSSTCH